MWEGENKVILPYLGILFEINRESFRKFDIGVIYKTTNNVYYKLLTHKYKDI